MGKMDCGDCGKAAPWVLLVVGLLFLGVDLGLAKIATVSDNKGKNTTFFRGEQTRFIRQKYYELRK